MQAPCCSCALVGSFLKLLADAFDQPSLVGCRDRLHSFSPRKTAVVHEQERRLKENCFPVSRR